MCNHSINGFAREQFFPLIFKKSRNLKISNAMIEIAGVECLGAQFILVVKKYIVFSRLVLDKFYEKVPCIIATGRGQPNIATRMFVHKLRYNL